MAFLEDPRLRQRWNQISHTTEAVTENAAAGIWSFGHQYINPCFASIGAALEGCTAPCFGDREGRARRKRDRDRTAEYSFDFYDDWDEDLGGEGQGGFMGGWRNEDWERLIGGTSRNKRVVAGEVQEQPRGRKRGMSYGTRGPRRKSSGVVEDPTIIPSTQPIGFLGKLPFKIGGTLRYKPSAANLQEHPGTSRHLEGEEQPLLGHSDDGYHPQDPMPQTRKRSSTTGSGATSDSYRSRGDLFPSDGEGEEDAVPLDDEFAVALDRVDDRASNKTKSSKGKKTASYTIPRSASRTTMDSISHSRPTSLRQAQSPIPDTEEAITLSTTSLRDLQHEEERVQREEDEEVERKRQAAAQLALERGLHRESMDFGFVPEAKPELVTVEDIPVPKQAELDVVESPAASSEATVEEPSISPSQKPDPPAGEFVPARLPYFK
ncbi:hypothetical protein AB5N19_13738 [Seiridium cardinale]|uniref:Uncharacterized protein n=1 Tax=Seiridium cardinale TaxID=138064 RepID=A0ABR2XKB8_9PEZI